MKTEGGRGKHSKIFMTWFIDIPKVNIIMNTNQLLSYFPPNTYLHFTSDIKTELYCETESIIPVLTHTKSHNSNAFLNS